MRFPRTFCAHYPQEHRLGNMASAAAFWTVPARWRFGVTTAMYVGEVNPKGIASSSPGLRGTSYPGKEEKIFANPEGVVPDWVEAETLSGLITICCLLSQGSSFLATLGFETESPWDSQEIRGVFAAQFPAARLGLEKKPLLTAGTLELTDDSSKKFGPALPSPRDYSSARTVVPPQDKHRQPLPEEPKRERQPAPAPAPHTGGLTVVGSYVPATTRQLAKAADLKSLLRIELCVDQLLSARRREHLAYVSATIARRLFAGQDVMVFTRRRLFRADTPSGSLQIGSRVSDALVELVKGLDVRPRYMLAKGGITPSDLATRAL